MPSHAPTTLRVNTDTFEQEVIRSDRPALVDFHAGWCPPCKALGPTIDALASEYEGRAVVAKVDVDESPALAQRYGVQSIPTLLVLKGGEVIAKRVGLAPKADLVELLERAIG